MRAVSRWEEDTKGRWRGYGTIGASIQNQWELPMPRSTDLSKYLAAFDQDSNLVAVIDDAYCIPFYVVKVS
jgi:hypothetical protein